MKRRIIFKRDTFIRNESGFALTALLVVFGIMAVIMTLGIVLLPLTQDETVQTNRETAATESLYVAEAGINNYLWHLNRNSDYFNEESHTAQGQDLNGDDKWTEYSGGSYHLEIVESTTTPGVILESTGRVERNGKTTTRTVRAVMTIRSFTTWIYFTECEYIPGSGNPPATLRFVTGDRIRGLLHTNDFIHIDGNPIFEGKVTTYSGLDIISGTPQFLGGYEKVDDPIELPVTNDSLKQWAETDDYCYYGKTTIALNGNKLTITNTNASNEGVTGVVDIPSNGVIYVDGLAASSSAKDYANPQNYTETNAENLYRQYKDNANTGDVYVSGTLDGKLTIASRNNIYVTNHLSYSNPDLNSSDDMLGLIGGNYVYILHRINGSDVSLSNLTINAAIFAIANSFKYEYHQADLKNTLTVNGSIVQKFRGAMGTYNSYTKARVSGYLKDYYYDPRMLYRQPPHFIPPANSGYQVVSWEEVH